MKRRERRVFTTEFKQQMVNLYHGGKRKVDIVREYDLAPSSLEKWIQQSETSGSFKHKDNLSDEDRRLRELEKENQHLKMENDILKQAALIMGRKSK